MNYSLQMKKLHVDAKIPVRANTTDAGLDFFALEDVTIKPGQIVKCRTGIAVSPIFDTEDIDYEMTYTSVCLVMDKSGLGAKGLKVFGGVIDDQYTGEVFIVLGNLSTNGVFDSIQGSIEDLLRLNAFGTEMLARSLVQSIKSALDQGTVTIKKGEKLAQLIMTSIELPFLEEVEEFTRLTNRGSAGFGSTGS